MFQRSRLHFCQPTSLLRTTRMRQSMSFGCTYSSVPCMPTTGTWTPASTHIVVAPQLHNNASSFSSTSLCFSDKTTTITSPASCFPYEDDALRQQVQKIILDHCDKSSELRTFCLNVGRKRHWNKHDELPTNDTEKETAVVELIFELFNKPKVVDWPSALDSFKDTVEGFSLSIPPKSTQPVQVLISDLHSAFQAWMKAKLGTLSFFDYADEAMRNDPDRHRLPVTKICPRILVNSECTGPLKSERSLDPKYYIDSFNILRLRSWPQNASDASETELSGATVAAQIRSGVVNLMTGASGSGKTGTTTLFARGTNNVVSFSTPHIPILPSERNMRPVNADDETPQLLANTNAKKVSTNQSAPIENPLFADIREANAGPSRDAETTDLFIKLVAGAIGHKVDPGTTYDMKYQLNRAAGSGTPLWSTTPNDSTTGRIFIVLDEFGGHTNFIRGLCKMWNATVDPEASLRQYLSRCFGVEAERIFLIVVGTGAENFQFGDVGSLLGSFRVFTIVTEKIFPQILLRLRDDKEKPKMWNDVARALIELLFHETKTNDGISVLREKPTDSVTHRFLQLVQNSPRCAAIALQLIEGSIISNMAFDRVWQWRPAVLRTFLPSWSTQIVFRFANMNGLARLEPADQRVSIGKSVRIALTKQESVTVDEWTLLAVDLGLLSDTAYWIDRKYFDRNVHVEIKVKGSTQRDRAYVFDKNMPRFRVAEVAVAIFLLDVGAFLAGSGSMFGAGWKLFEACIADFIALCWLLNIKADGPTESMFEMTSPADKKGDPPIKTYLPITDPLSLFAVADNCKAVSCGTLKYALTAEVMSNVAESTEVAKKMKDPQREWLMQRKDEWKGLVANNNFVIVQNIGNAPYADIIALSKGKIFLVQSKYYQKKSRLSDEKTKKAFNRMEDPSLLEYLADCCTQQNTDPLEIFTILASREPKNFATTTDTKPTTVTLSDRTQPVKISRRLISSFFPSKKESPTSLLYPVFQSDFVVDEEAVLDPVLKDDEYWDQPNMQALDVEKIELQKIKFRKNK